MYENVFALKSVWGMQMSDEATAENDSVEKKTAIGLGNSKKQEIRVV